MMSTIVEWYTKVVRVFNLRVPSTTVVLPVVLRRKNARWKNVVHVSTSISQLQLVSLFYDLLKII